MTKYTATISNSFAKIVTQVRKQRLRSVYDPGHVVQAHYFT
ncbi:hypothetical protein [Acinetobacter baumannii]|nr:hypothetical protein [Acinetobacter baumannii]MDV5263231.1 hypothetical protein [Acinetobacter baumannii]